MSKTTKTWLIIEASLVVIGCIVFGGMMTMLKWDFTKLSTVKYETNDYEINEDYKNISIVTDTADIVFVPTENSKGSVVCYEQKNAKHSVTVNDGTLEIPGNLIHEIGTSENGANDTSEPGLVIKVEN